MVLLRNIQIQLGRTASVILTMTTHRLKALHLIIGDAITEIESRFHEKGLDYPSLDDSYERSPSQILSEDAEILGATNKIIAASDHLIASVRSPYGTICRATMAVLTHHEFP